MDLVQLGNTHKNGSRFVGIFLGPVEPYARAGTPVANQMLQSSVDRDVVSQVGVGDRCSVRFEDDRWWVYVGGARAGRLTWTRGDDSGVPHIEGELEVTRLLLDPTDRVINFGGIVRPL